MPATDWSIVAINVGSAVGVIVAGLVTHAFVLLRSSGWRREAIACSKIRSRVTAPLRSD